MVTVFKENLNLQLSLVLYSSIMFVFETVFISEQTVENRFGTLLEIRDKFITKLNVFSCMILQFRLKTVLENFIIILYDFKNRGQVVLLERPQFVPQNLEMKLLEMGKDMKLKDSVSNIPRKCGGTFFLKKLCRGNNLFWINLWRVVLHGVMQGQRKSFTNAFSSNLSTVNLKTFPGHGGRHT